MTTPPRGAFAAPVRAALDAAAALWSVPPVHLLGRSRAATLSIRRAAVWAALHAAGLSSPVIGQAFARDHTTVLYGVRGARRRAAEDADYAAAVALITEEARRVA